MLDRQKVFDIVKEKMLAQGKRSMFNEYDCAYRNPDGLKCAIGHLIPDEMYDPKMESGSVIRLFENFPEIKEYLLNEFGNKNSERTEISDYNDTTFLLKLQQIHDYYEEWEYFAARLDNFAIKYKLRQ